MQQHSPALSQTWFDRLCWSVDGLLIVACLILPAVAFARVLRARLAIPLP